jgi:excisionase family DNA binding protein
LSLYTLYQRFHDETGNSVAASNLTLAHAMLAQQRVQHEIALTVAEAADRLKVSTKKVYQMVQAGEIPHNRVGNQIRILPSSLEELIRRPLGPRRSHPRLAI